MGNLQQSRPKLRNTVKFFSTVMKKKVNIIDTLERLRVETQAISIIVSNVNTIYFNLALEDYLMTKVQPKIPVFFWWRNDKNVVVGKHQCVWNECNLNLMRENKVVLARRFTGGGTVYQDTGNSCFSFIMTDDVFDKEKNNNIILDVLKKNFDIQGETKGRNDLVVDGKKFSGAAFKQLQLTKSNQGNSSESKTLNLHHGTILINTDLNALQKYLTPNKLKLESKGIQSVKSRVTNLYDFCPKISHELLKDMLSAEFQNQYGVGQFATNEPIRLVISNITDLMEIPDFKDVYDKFFDWNWRFGQPFDSTHHVERRFDWGHFDLQLSILNGMIKDAQLYTDSLQIDFVPIIQDALKGISVASDKISNVFDSLIEKHNEFSIQFEDIRKSMLEEFCQPSVDA